MRSIYFNFFSLPIFLFNFSLLPMIKKRVLGNANWGTHMVPLVTAVMNTSGPILELGCGDFSTPLLHAICAPKRRYILSVDSDRNWLNNFLDLKNTWHDFLFIPLYDNNNQIRAHFWDIVPTNRYWSVILIDHFPGERRVVDILRFAQNSDIIVIHDTQVAAESYYKYANVISQFKYKFVYERYKTETTIVSNTINVAKLFN